MECTLYVNRLKPNEFAVRFDQNMLMLQAANRKGANAWVVAIASCLSLLRLPEFRRAYRQLLARLCCGAQDVR